MSACPGCELLPQPLPTTGVLCLWPPLGHTHSKLRAAFAAGDIAVDGTSENCLTVGVSEGAFHALGELAATDLSEVERNQCKYLLLPDGGQPTLSDFGRVNSLTHLLAHMTGRWLVELLAERRLTTHFQPIVRTHAPEDVFAYECLVRGVDPAGKLISPGQLYDAARDASLLYHLDRSARLQHIKAAHQQGLQQVVFINFNPSSIYDPEFCLRSTIAAIEGTDMPPENFVFEVVESDHVTDIERLPKILEYYRRAGFRVALDDLGAGYSSLNMLGMLRPDFIKLDMQLIRGIDCDPYKGEIVGKLIESAHNLGVEVIAEGIETAGEWNWAAIHGADYTQGYLFGKPCAQPQPSCAVGGAASGVAASR
jgi:EAL domain-containing protein (putative c-di-GMP-specific phosphodiesterase class I)